MPNAPACDEQDDLFPLSTPAEIWPPSGAVEGPSGWLDGFGAGLRRHHREHAEVGPARSTGPNAPPPHEPGQFTRVAPHWCP